jgi:hypothetical protein
MYEEVFVPQYTIAIREAFASLSQLNLVYT